MKHCACASVHWPAASRFPTQWCIWHAAAKGLAVHEVPTLLPSWVPDGFGAFNPYGMGRHQVCNILLVL